MALNSTPRRRFGVALGVVLTGVTAGLIGFAGVASAHTPQVKASCQDGKTTLTVNLTRYVDGTKRGKENHVRITDNGKEIANTGFQSAYPDKGEKVFEASGAEKHTFVVDVTAWDGKQYNYYKELVVEACVTQPPTETTETTTTTTTPEVPPTTETTTSPAPAVVTSTTPPPPAAQGGPLAETGASIALPLGIGGVLLLGGVGALFAVRRRSKA